MDGRLLHLSPATPEFSAPLNEIMSKRALVTGALLRAYPLERKAILAEALRQQAWPEATRSLRPVIDLIYTLETAQDAHRRLDEGITFGKDIGRASWRERGGQY